MDTTSPAQAELDPSDFDRLGIQPRECRLTVIRRAATRAALTVSQTNQRRSKAVACNPNQEDAGSDQTMAGAEQTTTGPEPATGADADELSKVVSSTYRLMDPRRRQDAVERAHVGRILPGALLAAGQTKFHAGPFADAILDSTDHDLAAPVLIGDTAITETMHHEPWSVDSAHASTQLNAQLCAKDLIRRYASPTRAELVRDWVQHPRMILALIFTLLVTAGWLVAWQQSDSFGTPSSTLAVRRAPDSADTPKPAVSSIETMLSIEPVAPRHSSEIKSSESMATTIDVAPARDVGSREPNLKVAGSTENVNAEQSEPSTSRLIARQRGDWVLLIQSDMAPIHLDIPLREQESLSASTAPHQTADRFPVFTSNQTKPIHDKFIERLVNVDYFETTEEVTQLESDADQLARSSDAGSVEHWTAESIAAAPLWFTGRLSDLHKRWLRVAAVYDVEFINFVEQTFFEATALPCSARLSESLVEHGLTAVQWMLSENLLEPSERMTLSLLSLSTQVNRGKEIKQLDLLLAATKIAKRTSKRVALRSSADEPAASDSVLIGRHLCFVSGKWSEGLKWLARGSDARLAGLAKSELDLIESKSTKAQRWADLSNAWQTYAGGLSGQNEQTTMRHAADLLSRAISLATPIEELRWTRELETIQTELPSSLRFAQEFAKYLDTQESATAADAASVALRASPPTDMPSSVDTSNALEVKSIMMDGNVVVAGAVEVTQVRYQTGVVIGPGTMAKMIRHPTWMLLPMRLELVGKFLQPQAGGVRVGINVATRGVQQTVYLDDEPVEIDPLEGSGQLRVVQGEHSVRWIVEAAHFETVFLSLEF